MKLKYIYSLICLFSIFTSCQNTTPDKKDDELDIELFGSWHMINWNYEITVTNDEIIFNSGYTGDILSFDNTTNELIMIWTYHPAFTGKYQKWKWINDPIDGMYVYNEKDNQIDAINDTIVKYIDTIEKI